MLISAWSVTWGTENEKRTEGVAKSVVTLSGYGNIRILRVGRVGSEGVRGWEGAVTDPTMRECKYCLAPTVSPGLQEE